MTETSDHDVAMTSLLNVSGLESPERLRDASYHDDNGYHDKISISHLATTKRSPSIILSDNDYSKCIYMTSRRNYGNDVSNETSCWLSDAEYSTSTISVNSVDYGNKHHKQQHPRFMDISYKSAQLSDSIYTPSPVRLAHRPRRPVLGVTGLTLRHAPQQPLTRPRVPQQGPPPPQPQGIKRKIMSYEHVPTDESSVEDSTLQVRS